MGVVVHMKLAKSQNLLGKKQFVERLGTYTVLTTSINSVSRRQIVLKRMLDILGGLAGCIITGILCIFLGPAIYIQSPGPIFFKQTRVGKNGKMFQMYKFRSMYMDAEERKAELMKENRVQDGMMFKLDFDPRIIGSKKLPDGTIKKGVGNFIRDWSLDEFPQFLNVLKGDMSLVGTRPPTVDEWDKYELHHRARLATKPGLGFFAKTDVDVERYREFKPFSDTVIVIDYVLGNEDKCATIVTTLFERFEYSRFKLRLLFVDRRYQNNENNWYDRIVGKMDMQTRLWFQECSYNNKTTLSPLVISELSEEEELEFINVYLEAYLNNVADDDTKVKYSSVLPDTVDQIYSNFKTALKEECDRPLFVAVYTELWIYKDGCISVTSLDEMLAAFLKREEDRWLLCLDNHSNLLKDYVKLLALASASVLVCLDDDQGIYQQAAQNLQQYINASQRPGKKQTDFSDLFVYQEYAHDYDPPAVFDSNKSEILLSTENKLKEIYEVFPNEGKVVLGYSYLVSWNYVTWLDFPRPIDEELIPLFKKWIRKFPENKLELMEYYSFILFEKWLYMDSLDNISEANKIYYEIKAIADELSKDYADNQVTQMLSMGIVRKL